MEKHALVIPEFEDEQNNGSDDDSTYQSSLHRTAHKSSSVWNVFRKHKMTESQSIPSMDSINMAESGGLHPLWRGSRTSINSAQTEHTLTADYGTERSSQGIRG